MDIERLFRRAWEIVWNHKWFILLGVLVVLGTSGVGNPGGSVGGGDGPPFDGTPGPEGFDPDEFRPEDFMAGMDEDDWGLLALAIPAAVALCSLILLFKTALWILGRIAAGAIIAATDQIETTGTSSFRQAWSAGWSKGWRLIGIGLIWILPLLAAFLVAAALVVPAINIATDLEDIARVFAGGGLAFTASTILCLGVLATVILAIIGNLADRACMIEDLGVFDSYRRAWEIVTSRFGQVLLLAIVYIVTELIIGLVLFLPTTIAALCCLLWPLLWLVQGGIRAYFMTIWTLAWRDWTGRARMGEPVVQPTPGV